MKNVRHENKNMSAQSNLARGPHRGAVAHVRHIGPCGQRHAPNSPQKYPFPWTERQTTPHASSLDPSNLWCQTASGSDPPFFHNGLDRQTDRQTDRPTDRSRESLTTIGRYAPRATRPKNVKTHFYGKIYIRLKTSSKNVVCKIIRTNRKNY